MIQLLTGDCAMTRERSEADLCARLGGLPPDYVYLHTCHRVEWYYGDGATPAPIAAHLCRVITGLDSPLIGETDIHGQVKHAYRTAVAARHVSGGLHRLFQRALRIGRCVRRQTRLGAGALSYSRLAFECIGARCAAFPRARVVLIGAHALHQQLLRMLIAAGCPSITLVNRTLARAEHMACTHGCQAAPIEDLARVLARADVLVSATRAPHPIVSASIVPRQHRILVLDLAVPADVDAATHALPNVTMFTLAELERRAGDNHLQRRTAARVAEAIIVQELRRWFADRPWRNEMAA
jgi:glutamyl-tRNA reductase